MASTTGTTATGIFEDGDGRRLAATAVLAAGRLSVRSDSGEELAAWPVGDLIQSTEHLAIRLQPRRAGGSFLVPGDGNPGFVLALASVAAADAPIRPPMLVATMAGVVAASLVGLALLAWAFFALIDWLLGAAASGPGAVS